MRARAAIGALLVVSACRHRKVVSPPAPARPAARPQPRAPRPSPHPAPVPAPAPSAPARAPQELQSRTDASGDRATIEARLRDVRTQLDALGRRSLTAAEKQDRDRAASMADLAQQAFSQGNLRQADELSSRAAMLAKTLNNGR